MSGNSPVKQFLETLSRRKGVRKKKMSRDGMSNPSFFVPIFFFFPPLLFSRRRSIDTGLLYWAASRHRLFLYWPVSRCACGREGVSPDLPLPCWEATDRHGWARVGKEVAERGKVSVLVVVGREIFEQQTGRKGSSYRMGKESFPIHMELTCNPTISVRRCLARLPM